MNQHPLEVPESPQESVPENQKQDSTSDASQRSQTIVELEGIQPTSIPLRNRVQKQIAKKMKPSVLIPRLLPIVTWLPEYTLKKAQGDFIAGITACVMLVPQALAYSLLAGLPPQIGLYASSLPLMVYAFFGTSRHIALGNVAILSLLFATAITDLGATTMQDRVEAALVISFFVAVIELFLGMVSGGIMATFLSHAVLTGFTAGAAMVIAFTQLPSIFGITTPKSPYPLYPIGVMLANLPQTKWVTFAFGSISFVVLQTMRLLKRRLPKKIPENQFQSKSIGRLVKFLLHAVRLLLTFSPLIVVIIAIVVAQHLFQNGLTKQQLSIVGDIPLGFPAPSLPNLAKYSQQIPQILGVAVTIAFFAFVESIALSELYAKKMNYEIDPNQELIALGMAKLVGSFFNGYSVTGSLARTAINVESGAQTQMAGFITGTLVIFIYVFLGSVFYYLPKAVLSSLVIVSVIPLIDFAAIREAWAYAREDALVMVVTILATLALDIVVGLLVGVGLSVALVLKHAVFPHWAILGEISSNRTQEKLFRNICRYPDAILIPNIQILRLDAPLWFLNTKNVYKIIMKASALKGHDIPSDSADKITSSKSRPIKALILDCSTMESVDMSGIELLESLQTDLNKSGISFAICEVRGPIRDKITSATNFFLKKKDHERALLPWLHRTSLDGTGPWNFMTSTIPEAIEALQNAWNQNV